MKTNVYINGRSVVHANSNGMLQTRDICLTTIDELVIPIPYLNTAHTKDLDPATAAQSVRINGHPVAKLSTHIAKCSTGDERGDKKGVFSRTIQGYAYALTGSPDVLIEGEPAVRQYDSAVSNNGNSDPGIIMQPGAYSMGDIITTAFCQIPLDQQTLYHTKIKVECDDTQGFRALLSLHNIDGQHSIHSLPPEPITHFKNLVHDAYFLTMTFWDQDSGTYELPIGEISTVDSHQEVDINTILAPLLIARKQAGQPTEHALQCRQKGWIYIFINGHLWRELQTLTDGGYSEVNLTEIQNQDQRPPMGEVIEMVTIIKKINGKTPNIQVAFSELQWSWARINALGGMDPCDLRVTDKTLMPTVEQQKQAEKARHLRFETINLDNATISVAELKDPETFVKWRHTSLHVLALNDHMADVNKYMNQLIQAQKKQSPETEQYLQQLKSYLNNTIPSCNNFNTLMQDYFSLETERYGSAFASIIIIILAMQNNSYLKDLCEPQHPLHAAMFPKQDYQPPKDVKFSAEEPNTGTGNYYRPMALAKLLKYGFLVTKPGTHADDSLRHLKELFKRLIALAEDDKPQAFVDLINSTQDPELIALMGEEVLAV